jgi:hypothetical protein
MKSEYAALCATAKSRESLAAQCEAIALARGWTFERNEISCRGRELCFTCSNGGHHVNFDFDGASRVTAFLAHWWTDRDFTFPLGFSVFAGGRIDAYEARNGRQSNATTCVDTFEGFLKCLDVGFMKLAEDLRR